MIERALIAVIVLALVFVSYRLFKRRNLSQAAAAAPADPILAGLKPGVPAVVYFTTPTCAPCRTQQTPALMRLQAELGDHVQIVRIDATENPDAADRWGVFSAPTTFILDAGGQPREVNHGVADALKLRQQIEAVAG